MSAAFNAPADSRFGQSIPGWLAINALLLFSAVCYLSGAGALLRLVFPPLSLAVGIFLYVRYPVLYVGYSWWLWFLIALFRRMIDYRSGWDKQGVILIAPYLVSLITLATLFRYLPKSFRMGGLPFIISFAGVFYGFLIGLVSYSPILVFRNMLDWITPVLFGFHLFVNWRHYPQYRQNAQTVFLWGVLLTGTYGLVQFLIAPEWDRFWLLKSELTSMGHPEPFGIRVWSTMHSPAPFTTVMMAGLILLFSSNHPLRLPASVAGYLAFLLSLVRAAWGGWVIAVLSLLSTLKPKLQMRLMLTILVLVLCVVPLTTIEPFSKIISERFQSFSNLKQDQSYNDREANYDRKLSLALSNGLGNGIGGTWVLNEKNGKLEPIVIDSGILDTFFALGWFGTIPYFGGMMMILYKLYQGSESRNDSFANAARSIGLSVFLQLIFSSLMLGLSGIVLWGFMGIGMAANKYHQHFTAAGIRKY
ncbi:MAG: O-antigen ligase domain-containing protein [Nostocaceae cyanobacterium]|nr:O-antigen ligase domain-containing protein [Nostocaceae cyanobacterium]